MTKTQKQELKKAFDLITREAVKYEKAVYGFDVHTGRKCNKGGGVYKCNVLTYRAIRRHLMNGANVDAIGSGPKPAPLLVRWLADIALDEMEPTLALESFENLIDGRAAEMICKTVLNFEEWLKEWFIDYNALVYRNDVKSGYLFKVTACAFTVTAA